MSIVWFRLPLALALSLGVHAGLMLWAAQMSPHPPLAIPEPLQARLVIAPPAPETLAHSAKPRPRPAIPKPVMVEKERAPVADIPSPPVPEKQPATMAAPPAPTAEEWQLAATYTLKNSKRYRHNWGQLVRSMMGTAVEGERQGLVRLRIEIAPDGKLAKADVLWSTSEIVEKLALKAIRSLPPLPPTPTGKLLVFEKTIAFLPFETGWPPIYKYDCLPDPPSYQNPFAWNGSSSQPTSPSHPESASPSGNAAQETECPNAEPDTFDAEEKDMERQFKEWGSLGE
jgi:TonB family protein